MLKEWLRRELGLGSRYYRTDAQWVKVWEGHVRSAKLVGVLNVWAFALYVYKMGLNAGHPVGGLWFCLGLLALWQVQEIFLKQLPNAQKNLRNAILRCNRWPVHRN